MHIWHGVSPGKLIFVVLIIPHVLKQLYEIVPMAVNKKIMFLILYSIVLLWRLML